MTNNKVKEFPWPKRSGTEMVCIPLDNINNK